MAGIKFMFLSGSGFEQKQWQPAKSEIQNGHAGCEYIALASGKQALVRSRKPPPSGPPLSPPPPPFSTSPPIVYFEVYQMLLVLQLSRVSRHKNSQLSTGGAGGGAAYPVCGGWKSFDFVSTTSYLPSTLLPEKRAMGKTWEIPMLAGWSTVTHWFLDNTGVSCLAVLFFFFSFLSTQKVVFEYQKISRYRWPYP